MIESLGRSDCRQRGADLLETSIDELKQTILTLLSNGAHKPAASTFTTPHVYLTFSKDDTETSAKIESWLFDQGIEVFTLKLNSLKKSISANRNCGAPVWLLGSCRLPFGCGR